MLIEKNIIYYFYFSLGFLTMDSTDKYTSLEDIIGFVMIFIGLVYIILVRLLLKYFYILIISLQGLFGVKLIKDRRKNEYARSQS